MHFPLVLYRSQKEERPQFPLPCGTLPLPSWYPPDFQQNYLNYTDYPSMGHAVFTAGPRSSAEVAAGPCPRQSGCAHSLRLVTLEDRWPCRLPGHEDGAVQGPIPHHLVAVSNGIHNLLPLPLKHQSQQRARWDLWISRIPFTLLRHRHTAGSSGFLGLMASTWRRLRIASCEFLTNDIRALTQPLAPSEPSADAALVTR